jgi:hypothetical protein
VCAIGGGRLILGRAERYTIEQHPNAVVVRMRQGLRALGVAAVSLGVLIASWWFGPYGPEASYFDGLFYWIWSGAWGLFLVVALFGAAYRENWTFTAKEVLVKKSFRVSSTERRVPRASPLALRVEQAQGSPRKRPVFGWRVHVLDAQRNVCGLHFDLQRRDGVESLIAGLRLGLSLDVQSTV